MLSPDSSSIDRSKIRSLTTVFTPSSQKSEPTTHKSIHLGNYFEKAPEKQNSLKKFAHDTYIKEEKGQPKLFVHLNQPKSSDSHPSPNVKTSPFPADTSFLQKSNAKPTPSPAPKLPLQTPETPQQHIPEPSNISHFDPLSTPPVKDPNNQSTVSTQKPGVIETPPKVKSHVDVQERIIFD